MNRKLTKREHADRFAVALQDTTRRYVQGMMVRQTWLKHMTALWVQVEERGLMKDVTRRLGVR